MNKNLLGVSLLQLLCGCIFAQSPFYLDMAGKQPRHGLYDTISLRNDIPIGQGFGYVLNDDRMSRVVVDPDFGAQLSILMDSMVYKIGQNRELCLQLRMFRFDEEKRKNDFIGYFKCQGTLFEKKDSQYIYVATLDTTVGLYGENVGVFLMKRARGVVANFLFNNLGQESDKERIYKEVDLYRMEEIEMGRFPVYANKTLVDGMYLDYHSFKNQKPDYNEVVVYEEMRGGDYWYSAKYVNQQQRNVWVKPSQKVYGIVHRGRAYFYFGEELRKAWKAKNGEFRFVSPPVTPHKNQNAAHTAWLLGGAIGYLIYEGVTKDKNVDKYFEFRINPINGLPQVIGEDKGDRR